MAKKDFSAEEKKEEKKVEMTLEEAKAHRASLHKPAERVLQEYERREEFRVFWAKNRNQYGRQKDLEDVLWIHLKSAKLDDPKKFEEGLKHFGLKKIR
jgi:hypothetical protein